MFVNNCKEAICLGKEPISIYFFTILLKLKTLPLYLRFEIKRQPYKSKFNDYWYPKGN